LKNNASGRAEKRRGGASGGRSFSNALFSSVNADFFNSGSVTWIIDIQLGRLTPAPESPRSGRMNLGRRFNAGAAIHRTLRHVVTPEFKRRYATQRS
jgi:hypothetical protein